MSILSYQVKKLQRVTAAKEELAKIKELIEESILDETVNSAITSFRECSELTGLPEHNYFLYGEGYSWELVKNELGIAIIVSHEGVEDEQYCVSCYHSIKGKYLLIDDVCNHEGYTVIDITQAANPEHPAYVLASKMLGRDVLIETGINVI